MKITLFFAIRNHFVAGSFDEFAFNDFLDFETGGVGTEDQLLVNIGAFIEFLQKSIDQRCFAGASGADWQNRYFLFHAGHQDHSVSSGVGGGHEHFVVLDVVLWLPYSWA